MQNKRELVRALRTLLRPIVRLQIALGLNARDFIEILKTVYVEVASEEYGKRGRRANMSRVAVLTGLTRREVARLRTVSDHDPLDLHDPMVPVGRVLSAWHQDSRFLDKNRNPKPLPRDSIFAVLVDECRGDIPATAVIRELESAGTIRIEDGYVHVLSRYFMPLQLDGQAVERFGRVVGDVSGAITRNLMNADPSLSQFEGRAVHEQVSAASADAFRNYLDRRGQEFLEEMDDWLHDHAEKPGNGSGARLGVGVYMIGSID